MQKAFFLLLFYVSTTLGQQSDFKNINFKKVDGFAKSFKAKRKLNVRSLSMALTKNLNTDVEKLRAIYIWICHNIANDYSLYSLNSRKRNKYLKDSVRLHEWNSRFKKLLFKKLIRNKRTICTGYAYLLKEMCENVGIEAKIVNGFGRTSDLVLEELIEPNHSWNIVKLNNKWYLCDPTWATGISYPEENRFDFNYNDGYFLTVPEIFIFNHLPVNSSNSLLNQETPTLQEFSEVPLLYADAYNVLKEHTTPKKMHQEIKRNEKFTFEYQLRKKIDINSIKIVISSGANERSVKPKISVNENHLTLQSTFNKTGFYDVHLYIEKAIIATYTFNVSR